MIVLSFNTRGVGGARKQLALKRLVMSHKPNVLLIQETECEGSKARAIMEPWLKKWPFYYVDAVGQLGGLITRWSLTYKALSTTSSNSAISVKLEVKNIGFFFNILNIYGPYSDRITYCEQLANSKALSDSHILVGGDLNLTLSIREV